jgi:LmbE family N-acetylglucosaminyl deacetylase
LAQLAGAPSLTGRGTTEEAWLACEELSRLPRWTPFVPPPGRVVVVAPHPDDEILGVGGTMALLAAAGAHTVLVAVTDGEASHPGRQEELRRLRPQESVAAAACLGARPERTHRLGHPDGAIDGHRLGAELTELIRPGDLLLAPWCRDGHPDHDVVGSAAGTAAARRHARVLSYLVWAWHWAAPGRDMPWSQARRVELGREVARRKRRAAGCFLSQVAEPDPVLPLYVMRRLTRPFEVLLQS